MKNILIKGISEEEWKDYWEVRYKAIKGKFGKRVITYETKN